MRGGEALIRTLQAYYGETSATLTGVQGEVMRYMIAAVKKLNQGQPQFTAEESPPSGPTAASTWRTMLHTNPINFIPAPNEYTAAAIAAGFADATGKTGVVAVTRGPGALGAIQQMHMADLYEKPIVMLATTGPYEDLEHPNAAWQAIDYEKVYGSIAKKIIVATPNGGDTSKPNVANYMMQALEEANSGVKGPVVLVLPQETIAEELGDIAIPEPPSPKNLLPPDGSLQQAVRILEKAKQPVIMVGAGARHYEAEVHALAEKLHAPFFGMFADIAPRIDNPYYGGDLGYLPPDEAKKYILDKETDCVVVIGDKYLGRRQFLEFDPAFKDKQIIYIHEEDLKSHPHFDPQTRLIGSIPGTLKYLNAAQYHVPEEVQKERIAAREAVHHSATAAFAAHGQPVQAEKGFLLNPLSVFQSINKHLPSDALTVSDVGGFMTFFGAINGSTHQVIGTGECMGLAAGQLIGHALADKLKHPDTKRKYVLVIGDAGLDMNGQNGLKLLNDIGVDATVVVINNRGDGAIFNAEQRLACAESAGYATIRGGIPEDYCAMAQAKGCRAKRATIAPDFDKAFAEAMQNHTPGVKFIEAVTDIRYPVLGKTYVNSLLPKGTTMGGGLAA